MELSDTLSFPATKWECDLRPIEQSLWNWNFNRVNKKKIVASDHSPLLQCHDIHCQFLQLKFQEKLCFCLLKPVDPSFRF